MTYNVFGGTLSLTQSINQSRQNQSALPSKILKLNQINPIEKIQVARPSMRQLMYYH